MTLVDTNVLLDIATNDPMGALVVAATVAAAMRGVVLNLTRDPRRHRTYFPGVTLIAPDKSRMD
jgi:hypothetical protein